MARITEKMAIERIVELLKRLFDSTDANFDEILRSSGTKLDKDLSNIISSSEKTAFIQALQRIGINVSLFNEFKGVLSADPAGPHNDLDYYINDASYMIKVWHGDAWHEIGAPTQALTKQEILAKLGITEAELNKIKNLPADTNAELTKIKDGLIDYKVISGTVFNGHALDWEYVVPDGLKIYNDIRFGATDETDINWPQVFKVDLTKKSQWEKLGSVIDMGYGNAVKYYLNIYHDADGAITKMKMTDDDNVGAAYVGFVMQKVTITAVATDKVDNAKIINIQDTHGVKVTDISAFHRGDNIFEIFETLGANSIVKLNRKRGNVTYLGQLMKKEHGKFQDTDTEEIDYWLVNLFSSSNYGFLGVIKIPNKNLDWDTEYGTGSVFIGYKASSGITIGQLATGATYLGKEALGTVEVGSTKWVDGDGKGTLKHGSKSATFEKIIDKAKETAVQDTKLLDAGSTADIALIRNINKMRIQAATYATGVAFWLKDDKQGIDDTYVGITMINGAPKLSYKKHGETQKDIDLVKLVEIAGKTLTDVTFTADDGTVTHGKLLV